VVARWSLTGPETLTLLGGPLCDEGERHERLQGLLDAHRSLLLIALDPVRCARLLREAAPALDGASMLQVMMTQGGRNIGTANCRDRLRRPVGFDGTPLGSELRKEMRMKALRIGQQGGLDDLAVVDTQDPGDPGPGEVRVRIHASSLNFHDLGVVSRRAHVAEGRIPMSDGAGVIEAVGEGVTEFAPGEAVVSCFFPDWQSGGPVVDDFSRTPGDGIDGYARQVVVTPATWFTRAPQGYDHVEAATLTTAGLTAWRALVVEGDLKAGDVVLTLGTGGVSIFALQIAKAMGARVIVTSSSDEKLARAQALGADHTINYRLTEHWAASVLEVTGGRGADHVIEVVGPSTLPQSSEACRIGGHIALIGLLAGTGGEAPMVSLLLRQQRFQGLVVGSREMQKDFVRALDGLALRPVIDRVFPLEQTADAFRHEMSGQHFGKIGLRI
jgi:NADPH:quinone reductase-like Zn-dependent oxidoreductase